MSWLVFVHPYFKDINHYSHPDNPDTKRRRQAGGLDPYLAVPKEWSKRDKKILLKTVSPDQSGRGFKGNKNCNLFSMTTIIMLLVEEAQGGEDAA